LVRPDGATHLLGLRHGTSTTMRDATLKSVTEALGDVGIATFRCNFPYAENGKDRDSEARCAATVRSALTAANATSHPVPDRRVVIFSGAAATKKSEPRGATGFASTFFRETRSVRRTFRGKRNLVPSSLAARTGSESKGHASTMVARFQGSFDSMRSHGPRLKP
jgi:hypothetical protein